MEKVEIGSATIFCGDALEVLATLNDGAVDAVVSDPPYGITACPWDQVPPLDLMWRLFESKSKESANYVLFACGGFTIDLVNSNRSWYRYDLCWAKNNRVGFFNANLQPLRSHESILIFGKPGFQKTAVYNPQKTHGGRLFLERAPTRKAGGVYPPRKAYASKSDGMTHPHSVLSFSHDRGCNLPEKCLHPTMKPLQLLRWLILSYSNPGDVILDPFMGSCTTGEAAVRLGRRFIGIERERQYFDISCRRLEAIQQEANLLPDDIDTEGITAKAS